MKFKPKKKHINAKTDKPKSCPYLIAAFDAICKIPLSKSSLKESLASADNIQERAAIGCLESVERLCLSGITGLHAVRYLKSVLASYQDGIFPLALCPYTSPLINALEDQDEKAGIRTARGSSSPQINPTKERKKAPAEPDLTGFRR